MLLEWAGVCGAMMLFTYAGYPLLAFVLSKLAAKPVRKGCFRAPVSVILPVHNEGQRLIRKLENIKAQHYPRELIEVVVVDDGSTDDWVDDLPAGVSDGVKVIRFRERKGKAHALNAAMVMARGEIIVFTDARQTLTPHALDALLSNFADESVTAVAGTLVCATDGPEGIFRRYEEALRGWEAAWGSPAGASGALYAVRREAVVSLHHGTILDDLVISLSAAGAGRMTWERSAVACEAAEGHGRIWRRRIRTLAGNWQLLLHPVRYRSVWSHETFVQFFCHKVLRLVFPLFAAGFAVCMGMSAPGAVLPVTVAVMFLFAAGALASKRAARAVLQTFGSLVLAPLGGLAHYLLGRESVLWARR